MTKILYLKASPREERSFSVSIANEFIKEQKRLSRVDLVDVKDIFAMDIPPFDGFAVNAKYAVMRGGNPTSDEVMAWKKIEAVIEHFKSFDKYVFAVPMWNFGIPYRLKQYLDVIIQPGYTFTFSPEAGYKGLLGKKSAFVAYARGGEYSEGEAAAFDFQKKYFEVALGFMGITDVRSVVVEPTMAKGPEFAEQVKAAAIEQAIKIAASF